MTFLCAPQARRAPIDARLAEIAVASPTEIAEIVRRAWEACLDVASCFLPCNRRRAGEPSPSAAQLEARDAERLLWLQQVVICLVVRTNAPRPLPDPSTPCTRPPVDRYDTGRPTSLLDRFLGCYSTVTRRFRHQVAVCFGGRGLAGLMLHMARTGVFAGMPDLTMLRARRPLEGGGKEAVRANEWPTKEVAPQQATVTLALVQSALAHCAVGAAALVAGVEAEVRPEPDNPIDAGALAVFVCGVPVGYLPARSCRLVAPGCATVLAGEGPGRWQLQCRAKPALSIDVRDDWTLDAAVVEVKSHTDNLWTEQKMWLRALNEPAELPCERRRCGAVANGVPSTHHRHAHLTVVAPRSTSSDHAPGAATSAVMANQHDQPPASAPWLRLLPDHQTLRRHQRVSDGRGGSTHRRRLHVQGRWPPE